jgi:hypothetical protein
MDCITERQCEELKKMRAERSRNLDSKQKKSEVKLLTLFIDDYNCKLGVPWECMVQLEQDEIADRLLFEMTQRIENDHSGLSANDDSVPVRGNRQPHQR